MIKRFFFLSVLVLILTTFVCAQTKTNDVLEKQIKNLKVEKTFTLSYDDQGKNSKILVIGEDFGREQDDRAGLQNFSFGMAFFYPDKTLNTAPDTINLTFWAQSKKPKFAESNDLKMFAGGENLDLGNARYVSKPDRNMEYLNYKISRENLVKLAKSADAKLKIGNSEFKFTSEHLRIFAALVKISDPLIR